jgi:ribonuclease H / adenosylcobalamin/alpha-ribazole phosphatase
MSINRVIVEADGGARGNPGPAGYGAVVRDAESGEVLAERAVSLGVATNNVAEYSGLVAGLAAAAELGAREVDVRMDSKLVIEQMSGRWQIKHPGLRPLAAEAAALVQRFEAVRFEWVPRERNKDADALANKAMDEAAGKSPKVEPRGSWEPPSGVPTRMVLVRHGSTELTVQRRYSGRGDVPLAEVGREQAAGAAERVARLTGGEVTAVLSSPLARCTETAAIIAKALGDPAVTTDPDLIECDFGDWEGRTFAEIKERWPRELDAWLASTAVAPPGGESIRAIGRRVNRLAGRVRDGYPGGTVVLVSHVTPINLLLRDALGASDAFLYRLHLDPTGVSIVDSWADGGVSVRTVNDVAHLPRL